MMSATGAARWTVGVALAAGLFLGCASNDNPMDEIMAKDIRGRIESLRRHVTIIDGHEKTGDQQAGAHSRQGDLAPFSKFGIESVKVDGDGRRDGIDACRELGQR